MGNKELYDRGYVAGAKCALLNPGVPSSQESQPTASVRGWFRGYNATQEMLKQGRFLQFASRCCI